jgi:hypothetical protein
MIIIKVLLISTLISIFIKYIAPSLAIAPTPLNALIGVFTPTIILGVYLLTNR